MTAFRRIRFLRALDGLAIVLVLVAHDLGWQHFHTLAAVDRHLYDTRQSEQVSGHDPRIVIVDIDEHSLAEQGRWPWPRETIAALNDAIFEKGRPAVVGYDTLFAEPERDPGGDETLAASLHGRPAVLGFYLTSDRSGRRTGVLPEPAFDGAAAAAMGLDLVQTDGYGSNLQQFAVAAGQGFFNPFIGAGIDVDGTIRALPLLAAHGSGVYESFAVAVLRRYLGATALVATPESLRLRGDRGEVEIPVSVAYTAMVPFEGRGGPGGGRFRYLSATDVLEGRVDWSLMRGRVVLVGTSAPGLTDLRATPANEVFPGVEIHASLIAGALDGSIRTRPADAGTIAAAGSLAVGGALALVLPLMGPIGTLVACGIGLLLVIGGNIVAYSTFGLILPLAASVAAILLLMVFNLVLGYLAEGRSRRAVLRLFGEYLSPALVEQMARDPARWRAGEIANKEITILFADIRGFTRMAESMDPAALREYLTAVLTGMTSIVHRHGGTVDKYIGDAVMAFWGAPLDDPRHADRAVEAAVAMQQEARRLSADFVMRGLPPLSIGIGVNTGVAQVGDMGSAARRAYTAIGDAVNLASRLESLTKRYQAQIIVGEATTRSCSQYAFDELGSTVIEGRTEPVRIFVPRVEMPWAQAPRAQAAARPVAQPETDAQPPAVAITAGEAGGRPGERSGHAGAALETAGNEARAAMPASRPVPRAAVELPAGHDA